MICEAELLWNAERNKLNTKNLISACWGSVALLVNPDSQVSSEFLDSWKNRITAEHGYGKQKHTQQEDPVVTDNGFLNIPWPKLVKDDSALSMDILLATATNPTLKGCPSTYPRIKEIARAWKRDSYGNEQYF